MNIVLDLIVLGIILLCILISARKGFVKVLVETVGFIAAIVIAFSVSSPLADLAYDKVIEPPIIEAAVNSAGENAEQEAKNALPGFIDNESSFGSSVVNDFTQSIKQNISAGTETAVKSASQQIVKPVAVKILSLLFSVILILVLMIVVKFLARLLNKMFSFSIVGKLNRALGGLVGVFKGVGFAMIFCMLISLLLSFTGKPFLIFSQENINNTYLFKFLTEIIPFN